MFDTSRVFAEGHPLSLLHGHVACASDGLRKLKLRHIIGGAFGTLWRSLSYGVSCDSRFLKKGLAIFYPRPPS